MTPKPQNLLRLALASSVTREQQEFHLANHEHATGMTRSSPTLPVHLSDVEAFRKLGCYNSCVLCEKWYFKVIQQHF